MPSNRPDPPMTTPSERERAEYPEWGSATVCRDEETGELFWKCEIDMEYGDTKSPTIELAANTFKEGTIVRIYEPT